MFRNVRLFRLHGAWPDSEQAVSEKLSAAAFEPCGSFAETSTGFEPPTGDAVGLLARRVENADLLKLRSQTRILPAAAVEDALEARVVQWRERMGAEPGRRELRKLKAQLRDELLPKAFLRSQRTSALVLVPERILAIDSLSDARTETFINTLRTALDDFDAVPLGFARPVPDLLTRIFLGDAPRGFALGTECRFVDPSDTRASIRCTELDLTDATLRTHLRHGMRLTQLGISFDEVLSCTLDEKGGIAKLKLLGADLPEDLPEEDPLARLDAGIALLAGTLRRLLAALAQALGGYEEREGVPERLAVA